MGKSNSGSFKPGQKKPTGSGRKKGQITKDRQMLLDKAKELDVDPFEILLLFAADRWKDLGYAKAEQTVYTAGGGHFQERTISAELRARCAADACQYMLPRLKAIDVNVGDDNGNISVTLNLGNPNAPKGQSKPSGSDPSPA